MLDGHTRQEICERHGLPYRTMVLDLASREDAMIWICENQIHRRNLNELQRAMVGDTIATLKQGARTDLSPIGGMSQPKAAEAMNVGARSIQRARVIRQHGSPKLIEAATRGIISGSVGEALSKLPLEEQERVAQECLARGDAQPARVAASEVRRQAKSKKPVATDAPAIDEDRLSTRDLSETVLQAFRLSLRIRLLTTSTVKAGGLTPERRKELADKCRRVAEQFIGAADYLGGIPQAHDMMPVVDA
jgi:hypothetical protein